MSMLVDVGVGWVLVGAGAAHSHGLCTIIR